MQITPGRRSSSSYATTAARSSACHADINQITRARLIQLEFLLQALLVLFELEYFLEVMVALSNETNAVVEQTSQPLVMVGVELLVEEVLLRLERAVDFVRELFDVRHERLLSALIEFGQMLDVNVLSVATRNRTGQQQEENAFDFIERVF